MNRYLINSIFRFILLIFLTKLRSTGDVMMMIERRKKEERINVYIIDSDVYILPMIYIDINEEINILYRNYFFLK